MSWGGSLVLAVCGTKGVEVDVEMGSDTGELVNRFKTESGRSGPMVRSKMRNCLFVMIPSFSLWLPKFKSATPKQCIFKSCFCFSYGNIHV